VRTGCPAVARGMDVRNSKLKNLSDRVCGLLHHWCIGAVYVDLASLRWGSLGRWRRGYPGCEDGRSQRWQNLRCETIYDGYQVSRWPAK
jgi:hypothetical protein